MKMMKMIIKPESVDAGRVVEYFGLSISVPKQTCWVSTNEFGKVWIHHTEPKVSDHGWSSIRNISAGLYVHMEGIDWKETCVKYEYHEPKLISSSMVEVCYFGLKFTVPNHGHIAMDQDSQVYWFCDRPTMFRGDGMFIANTGSQFRIGKVELIGLDWTESLRRVGEL